MKKIIFHLLLFCFARQSCAQQLKQLVFDYAHPFAIRELKTGDTSFPVSLPFFGIELNGEAMLDVEARFTDFFSEKKLHLLLVADEKFNNGYKATLTFTNNGNTAVTLSNIIPFGAADSHYYISGKLLADTSRSFLYQPGKEPLAVIVPHNNNDLNFTAIELGGNKTLFALIRRSNDSIQNYLLNRSPAVLQPGSRMSFDFYADIVDGGWHDALRKCFQEKMLYEVPVFNDSLYQRKDLDFIRHAFTMHLMMAWEKNYYSAKDGAYTFKAFLLDKKKLYGGDDIFTIWPTWPVLGLDQRSQWNLMESLPGGLEKQGELAAFAHAAGTKYFISYNPWDDKDEKISLQTMSDVLKKINADGVVLDTRAEGSAALQHAVDNARQGIVLYSEGMAVPKDMQGIIAGRVHNDIYYPPLLNLNKFIKPCFAIFRVAEVNRERIRREYATALFNGYGVEINIMRPGRQEWMDEDYHFWGRCARILKENSDNFISVNWTPLIASLKDKVYINQWPGKRKTVYTIFSLIPGGFKEPLFEVAIQPGFHLVDLWNHENVAVKKIEGKDHAVVELESFNRKYLGTNNEGAVNSIVSLPQLLNVQLDGDKISISAPEGSSLQIWFGNPSYDKEAVTIASTRSSFHLFEKFGRKEGKYVIQLFDSTALLDEAILNIIPGTPLLVSSPEHTAVASVAPAGMVKIPGGTFTMEVANGDEFIAYPKQDYPKSISLKNFYMDKYPVTNREFKNFIDGSGYLPTDSFNFLKHWVNGKPKKEEEQFPVVNVSYEDAKAYALWTGKRLPTESEWQYAAQATDGRRWPWGNTVNKQGGLQKNISTTLTVVDYGIPGASFCNSGNGKLYPVGKYKKGVNPFGLYDLVGCVWQITNDWYQGDSYEYILLKGGSYYQPGGSWWFVQGGPKPLRYRQMLLRLSQGFERNATVGFRCVKDAE